MIKRALTAYTHNKCSQCELDIREGNTHAIYKRIRELSRRKTTLTNVLLDKNGNQINDATGIRERWKQHFHEKLNLPINPNPVALRNLTISPLEPSPPTLRSEVEAALK
ncbi:hypothetical protein QYM36_000435 [Artemia franciscana]|uniref:Uncharacterized protein n=1 Tax=Artemia franciscana TaxID=6661 RepID=A0AA88LGE9_ARTSF|nr:hypothetical protein QYM36_000435 [Artemia franciscana]